MVLVQENAYIVVLMLAMGAVKGVALEAALILAQIVVLVVVMLNVTLHAMANVLLHAVTAVLIHVVKNVIQHAPGVQVHVLAVIAVLILAPQIAQAVRLIAPPVAQTLVQPHVQRVANKTAMLLVAIAVKE